MYICPNCKTESEAKINFCPKCGNAMAEVVAEPVVEASVVEAPVVNEPAMAPVAETPVAVQPTYQPVYQQPIYQQPKPAYSKAPAIVGMILSISGLVMSFLGFIYTALFIALEPEAGFIFSLYFSFFTFPLSIVGMSLGNKNANLGDTSAFVRVAKILGIIGLVLAGLMVFLGFACLTEM